MAKKSNRQTLNPRSKAYEAVARLERFRPEQLERTFPLSYVRSLTQSQKIGASTRTRKLQTGSLLKKPLWDLSNKDIFNLKFFVPSSELKERICNERKKRRRVMFAIGFAGSRAKRVPRYTGASLVRCN